jgi:ABC-type nitrate/sulfonate/bicarbonate transport system substrate-binding protein
VAKAIGVSGATISEAEADRISQELERNISTEEGRKRFAKITETSGVFWSAAGEILPLIKAGQTEAAVDMLEAGRIRLIMKASDLTTMAGQTSRVITANSQDMKKRPDLYARFMDAYRETIDWIYDTPEGVKAYADWAKVSEAIGKRSLAEFLPKAAVQTDEVRGIDQNMRTALDAKYISAPLTREQIAELVQIPARGKK